MSVILLALLPALTSLSAHAIAAGTPALVQSQVDLKQAVSIAQDAFGGEVVKTEEVERDGRRLFQIRLVNEGRVRDVLVDAESGTILNP
jgi:uncharacterized membrane protein YkoI